MKRDLLDIFENEEKDFKNSLLSGVATTIVGTGGLAFTIGSSISSNLEIGNKAIIVGSSIAIMGIGLFKYASNHKSLEEIKLEKEKLKEIKKMILDEYSKQLNNLKSTIQENNDVYNLIIEELKQNKLVKKIK